MPKKAGFAEAADYGPSAQKTVVQDGGESPESFRSVR